MRPPDSGRPSKLSQNSFAKNREKKNVRIGNDADFVVVTCIFSGEEDVRQILLCSFRLYLSRILAAKHAGMV